MVAILSPNQSKLYGKLTFLQQNGDIHVITSRVTCWVLIIDMLGLGGSSLGHFSDTYFLQNSARVDYFQRQIGG
jgi:hypothetical protein